LFYKIVTHYLTPRKQLGASSSIVCDSQGGHPCLSSNSVYEVWQGAEFWQRNGEVLVAGGQNSNLMYPFISSAELYNPATGKWSSTGNLNTARYNHTATLLNNGQVLIAGGGVHLASAELYNPSTGKFGVTGSLNTGRTDHSASLLTDGEVLAIGGYDGSGSNIVYLASAELFH
jgi:hypothetical protein